MEQKEAPRFHVFYGREHTQLDVTFDVLFTCCSGKRISIPATNQKQDQLFSDPCPGVVKKVTIRENDNLYDFSDEMVVHDCELNGEMLHFANQLRKRTNNIHEFCFLLVFQCHCRGDQRILKIGTKYNAIDTTTTTSVPDAERDVLLALANDDVLLTPKKNSKDHCKKKVYCVKKLQDKTKQVFHTLVFESAKILCVALDKNVEEAFQNVSCVIVQTKLCPSKYDTVAFDLLTSHSFACHFLCGQFGTINVFLRQNKVNNLRGKKTEDLTQTLQCFCTDYSNVLIVGCKHLQLPCSSLARFTIIEKDQKTLLAFENRHKKFAFDLSTTTTIEGELSQSKQQETVHFHIANDSNVYNTLVFETLHGLELFLQIGFERLADANKIIFKCDKLERAQEMQGILNSLQFYEKQTYVYRDLYTIFIFHKQVNLA